MKLSKLKLYNYRSYKNLDLVFGKNLNILIGENGSGKTNLLEAIAYLSNLKSFRGIKDNYLYHHDEEYFSIISQVIYREEEKELKVISSNGDKFLSIDDKKIKKSSEFIGKINTVVFTPDEVNFFNQEPRLRRRFLDLEISKIDQEYLLKFKNFMNLYNKKLKILNQEVVDLNLLEIINSQFVELSIYISQTRLKFLSELVFNINQLLKSNNKNWQVTFKYHSSLSKTSEFYRDISQKEASSRRIYHAAHRDDFSFEIDNQALELFYSQGQKRLIVVAMKIALVELINQRKGEYPILILDDIFSELDVMNKSLIIQLIDKKVQVFISTCEEIKDIELKACDIYRVQNNLVEKLR